MKTRLIHSNSSASLSYGFDVGNSFIRTSPGNSEDGNDSFGVKVEYNQAEGGRELSSLCQRAFQIKNIQRTFPILKWTREYTVAKLVSDIIAGITVGLTVLPQGLAYATVAGLPPIYGLYSSFVGCFVYIIFGSTKAITIGPTAIQSILTYKYTYGRPPEYAIFLCFITAVVTLGMGILRLGVIANFISSPVISGFTSGVAITIVATQLKSLLGLSFDREGFMPTLQGVYEHIGEIRKWDAILSAICLLTYLFLKYLQTFVRNFIQFEAGKTCDKFLWFISTSRSALIIITATALVAGQFPEPDYPFRLVGHIDPGLPAFKPPPFSVWDNKTNSTINFWDILSEEASTIVILPLLGVMGHITIAKAFAGTSRVDCTQEILCIGISNAISCFFSSYSIGGSFSRTTLNVMSGAESPAGGILTGIMVLLALQFLTPYFFFIPKAALAAIISGSVMFMIDLSIIKPLWRSKKMDMIPWFVTLAATLILGLEFGIIIGLIISVLYLLYYAARPRIKVMRGETTDGNEFTIVVLDRSMTFPSVDHITYEIGKAVDRWGDRKSPIVIDCHHIQYADFTAAEAIRDMLSNLKRQGHDILFWKLKPSILQILKGAMYGTGIAFVHCQSESDVETMIDGANAIHRSELSRLGSAESNSTLESHISWNLTPTPDVDVDSGRKRIGHSHVHSDTHNQVHSDTNNHNGNTQNN